MDTCEKRQGAKKRKAVHRTRPLNPLPSLLCLVNLTAWGILSLFFIFAFSFPAHAAQANVLSPASAADHEPRRHDPLKGKDIPECLVLANQSYLDGDYTAAAEGYEALLARGHVNGHLFYNLGNCYVRLGRIGRAILNYKKALLLLPRDGDLKANLQYARSLCQDRIEESPASIGRTLAFWYFGLNFRGMLLALCILNGLFWLSVLVKLSRDSEWVRWSIALSLMVSLLMGASAVLKYRETFHNKEGVILAEEAPVRAGFSRKDTVLFILHEGAEFKVIGQEKGWWKIELPDGKKGWLPQDSGKRILLSPTPEPTVP